LEPLARLQFRREADRHAARLTGDSQVRRTCPDGDRLLQRLPDLRTDEPGRYCSRRGSRARRRPPPRLYATLILAAEATRSLRSRQLSRTAHDPSCRNCGIAATGSFRFFAAKLSISSAPVA